MARASLMASAGDLEAAGVPLESGGKELAVTLMAGG